MQDNRAAPEKRGAIHFDFSAMQTKLRQMPHKLESHCSL